MTRFEEIERAAEAQGMLVVENWEPDLGISHSLRLGLQKALEENPELKGAMFIVCDQPGLTAATFARMLDIGKKYPGKIVCAGRKAKWEILYCGIDAFLMNLAGFPATKAGNRSSEHI